MPINDKTKWVKADPAFIERYYDWKQQKQQKQLISIQEKSTIPKLVDKQTLPTIKRNGMLTTSNLSLISTNNNNEESYRLDGDLMEYLVELEKQNLNLQTQLEVALMNLRGSDLSHQRILMQSKSQNDRLAAEILAAMQRIEEQSNLHASEKALLMNELEELKKQVDEVCGTPEEKGEELKKLSKRVSQLGIDSSSSNGKDSNASYLESKIVSKTTLTETTTKIPKALTTAIPENTVIPSRTVSLQTVSEQPLVASLPTKVRKHTASAATVFSKTRIVENQNSTDRPTRSLPPVISKLESTTSMKDTFIIETKFSDPPVSTDCEIQQDVLKDPDPTAATNIQPRKPSAQSFDIQMESITFQTHVKSDSTSKTANIESEIAPFNSDIVETLITREQSQTFSKLISENIELESLIQTTNETKQILDIQNSDINEMQSKISKAVSRVSSVMSLRDQSIILPNVEIVPEETLALVEKSEFQWLIILKIGELGFQGQGTRRGY